MRPLQRRARDWNIVGPFASPQMPGTELSPAIDSVFGPERDPDLSASYVGLGVHGPGRGSYGRAPLVGTAVSRTGPVVVPPCVPSTGRYATALDSRLTPKRQSVDVPKALHPDM